ncbi:MAG: peptidase T, partial [Schleiferiaceae bacterium]|nr:peptidase T [Schleiferiaceae bacterium]
MSSALERLLRYVQIDTQSDPHSTASPTTEKQKDLGHMLVSELHAIGLNDAELDDHGYVYATLAATTERDVPVICW